MRTLRAVAHVYWMGMKELRQFARDPALVLFATYAFTFYVATAGGGITREVRNAAVAIADEDRSATSRAIRDALRPPRFAPRVARDAREIERGLRTGKFMFALQIPRGFERDRTAGRPASIHLDVDATAVSQAALGAQYIGAIVARQLSPESARLARPVVRTRFNPNHESTWHVSLVELMFVVTLLSMILPAAALLRDHERGALEHLLSTPLRPLELVLAKMWPNSAIVTLGALVSLVGIVHGYFGAPLRGSILAFAAGTLLFQLTTASLGIVLATAVRSVAQVALLALLIVSPMLFLSGAWTPIESLPEGMRLATVVSPLRYYAELVFAIVLRGAPAPLLWKPTAALAALGTAFLVVGCLRFRARFAAAQQ